MSGPGRALGRRAFLRGAGRAALWSAAAPALLAQLAGCGPSRALRGGLAGFYRDAGSAAEVGRQFLRHFPQEAGADRLVERLAGARLEEWEALAAERPGALAPLLRAQHREDFAAGRTFLLHGWLLSATELRLCALAAGGEREEEPGPLVPEAPGLQNGENGSR